MLVFLNLAKHQHLGVPQRGYWLTGRINGAVALWNWLFLTGSQVGYLQLCGFLLGFEFASNSPRTNK